MPDTLFNSPLTVGKIRFDESKISGHLEAMLGVGLPDGRCEFQGKMLLGPSRVSLSIQDVIDDWNEHSSPFCDDEAPRSSDPDADRPKEESTDDESATTSSPSTTSDEWTEEYPEGFVRYITGVYKIASEAIEGEWSSTSQRLTIRSHVNHEQQKVWGR
jgi:hypothetical protein